MSAERKCCDDIIQAQADVESLERESDAWRKDAQIWRDGHEQRNNESFDRAFNMIEKSNADLNKRLQGIEDKLANRLPLWVTAVFSITGGTIGVLVTLLVLLANHVI